MGFNWIDWVLILVIGLYGLSGWQKGFGRILADLAIFVGVLWLAVRYHTLVGSFVVEKFGIPVMWQDTIGYLAIWVIGETGLSIVVNLLFMRIPGWISRSWLNRGLGAVISATKALAVATLVTLIVVALPVSGTIKQDIQQSQIGGRLLVLTDKYSGTIKTTMNQAAAQVIKFVTVKPESGETLSLPIGEGCKLEIDSNAENEMLAYVNARRVEAGVKALKTDGQIHEVARKHSQDMFARKYFSHNTPEGTDAGDRLTAGGVEYTYAGENIAYAPDTKTANQGLYDSEGHRKNMLDRGFTRIGLGVVNGGVCGMMFTQDFAN